MRICSFLPSATEIIYALGLQDQLYGVTHECDYPPEARDKPKLTSSALSSSKDSKEIDEKVRSALREGAPIYTLDLDALSSAAPDIIFTQELCEVCAVSYGEIFRAASKLPKRPEVISLDTFYLKDILNSILMIGSKCGKTKEAKALVEKLNARIEQATVRKPDGGIPKKLFFMEWIDPLMSGGHWMSELIDRAGFHDPFAMPGKNSVRVDWERVREYAPEYLVIAPCGFGVQRAEEEAQVLKKMEGWKDLPAVQNHNVFVADGNAYFSRPGPRIVDGLEILTCILNTDKQQNYHFGTSDYTRID